MRYFMPGEEPFETLPKFSERYKHLWMGIVRRIDQDNETCDVQWLNLPGGRTAVPYTFALSGRRAFMGGPPEEGSIVFCHWIPQTAMGMMSPIIVAYGPSGFTPQRRFDLTRELIDPETFPGRRVKTPKLYSGDVAMVSAQGSHVLADENLSLASASLTEILLRSADLSIIYNALQHYVEGAGCRSRMGMVERQELGANSDPLQEDDRLTRYVTKGRNTSPLESNGEAWSEIRWEVRETSDGGLVVPETLFGNKDVARTWLVQQVMGVLVGDIPSETTRYGKPLIRKVLNGLVVDRDYLVANDASQETTATSVWHIAVPNGTTDCKAFKGSLDLDRAGRLAISLGKTASDHPVGEGKSLQIAADGSVSAVIGKEASGDLSTNIKLEGDSQLEVGGDSTTSIQGNDTYGVGGESDVDITGNSKHTVGGQYDLVVTGNSNIGGAIVFLGGGSGASLRPI